jgi:hypothetical protein
MAGEEVPGRESRLTAPMTTVCICSGSLTGLARDVSRNLKANVPTAGVMPYAVIVAMCGTAAATVCPNAAFDTEAAALVASMVASNIERGAAGDPYGVFSRNKSGICAHAIGAVKRSGGVAAKNLAPAQSRAVAGNPIGGFGKSDGALAASSARHMAPSTRRMAPLHRNCLHCAANAAPCAVNGPVVGHHGVIVSKNGGVGRMNPLVSFPHPPERLHRIRPRRAPPWRSTRRGLRHDITGRPRSPSSRRRSAGPRG